MRGSLNLLIVALLLFPSVIHAEQSASLGTRQSRHIIMPFLGYQNMNGEQIGTDVTVVYADVIRDSVIVARTVDSDERDFNAPFLGLLYRFRASHQLNLDATFSVAHDSESRSTFARIDVVGFPRYHEVISKHGNTYISTIGAGYTLPLNSKWFTGGLSASGGYAWRDIEFKTTVGEESFVSGFVSDADKLYLVKGGLNGAIWRNNNLLIEMSVYYTQFMPLDSDVDPFGGIGWTASLFPVWFGN